MSLTCATCHKKIDCMLALADHISDTFKGIQGDLLHVPGQKELKNDPKMAEQYDSAMKGHAHLMYYDKKGELISKAEADRLWHILVIWGGCSRRKEFPDSIRRYQYYIESGHAPGLEAHAKMEMKKFEELGRKYSDPQQLIP